MKNTILIIDDDHYIVNLLDNFFRREGYQTHVLTKGKPALKLIQSERIDVVLCDIRLPDINGVELLEMLRKLAPGIPVIMMTAYAGIRAAVDSMKSGAFDYVAKPILPEEILSIVNRAIKKKQAPTPEPEHDFITGNSPQMLNLIDQATLVAPTNMSVLIMGETGSGKEYIARLIHNRSKRKDKKFVAIDCGAIPKELAASELFGHVKGAFTGAISNKTGFFEQANNGTIFLDEIGNLSYDTQVKLMRAIQQKVITRVGDTKPIPVDVRIISATNSNLLQAAGDGHFREDLYHRINEFELELPPLRKRGDDITIFANHFLQEATNDLEKDVKGFDDDVKVAFQNYSWYGNLRELRNIVKRSVLITKSDFVELNALPEELKEKNEAHYREQEHTSDTLDLKAAALQAEKVVLERALQKANYNKSLAAKLLNIDRKTLYNKMSQLGMEP